MQPWVGTNMFNSIPIGLFLSDMDRGGGVFCPPPPMVHMIQSPTFLGRLIKKIFDLKL